MASHDTHPRRLLAAPVPPTSRLKEVAKFAVPGVVFLGVYAVMQSMVPPEPPLPPLYRLPTMRATVQGECPGARDWNNGMTVETSAFLRIGSLSTLFAPECLDGRCYSEETQPHWMIRIYDVRQDLIMGTCKMTGEGYDGCPIALTAVCVPAP